MLVLVRRYVGDALAIRWRCSARKSSTHNEHTTSTSPTSPQDIAKLAPNITIKFLNPDMTHCIIDGRLWRHSGTTCAFECFWHECVWILNSFLTTRAHSVSNNSPQTFSYMFNSFRVRSSLILFFCTYTFTYRSTTHLLIHTYTYIYIHMFIRIYTYIYIYIYIYVYIYLHIHYTYLLFCILHLYIYLLNRKITL